MDDGSVRTAIENWAESTLTAANDVFKAANPTVTAFNLIELFRGTDHPSGAPQFHEMAGPQTPSARVATWTMERRKETSGPADWITQLHVYVATQAPSLTAMPRIGTAELIGLNRAVELVIDALDEKVPNVTNSEGDRYADSCEFDRDVGLGQEKGLYVTLILFDVRIVKK